MTKKIDIDVNMLEQLLVDGATQKECAEIFGCCQQVINRLVKKHDIKHPGRKTQFGTWTNCLNKFSKPSRGKSTKNNSMLKADLADMEGEFSEGWDSSNKMGW